MLDMSHAQGNEQMHHGGANTDDVDALSANQTANQRISRLGGEYPNI